MKKVLKKILSKSTAALSQKQAFVRLRCKKSSFCSFQLFFILSASGGRLIWSTFDCRNCCCCVVVVTNEKPSGSFSVILKNYFQE